MKRNFLLASFVALTAVAFGQMIPTTELYTPIHDGSKPGNSLTRGITEMVIWYGGAESELYGSNNYSQFIWRNSFNYTQQDSSLKYVTVAYPFIVDELGDPNSELPWTSVTSMTIDTLYLQIGHKNNSGQPDTMRVKIVDLTTQGRPTSTVLWQQDYITTTGFVDSATSWLSSTFYPVAPGIQVTEPFGVTIEYYGASIDTFGIVAGFATNGPCVGTTPKAETSLYATNSFRFYTQYASIGLLPTANGADIYYDCNQNGSFDQGIDGVNFMQNINIAAQVTIQDNISVEELPSALNSVSDNYPNPFSTTSTIDFVLNNRANVSLMVTDMSGRTVQNQYLGMLTAGNHKATISADKLADGIYFYTLTINGENITRKMVVKK